jgi:hypothetical protein
LRGDAEWDLVAPPSRKYLHLEGVKFGYEGEKEMRVAARFRLERRESLQMLERQPFVHFNCLIIVWIFQLII